MKPHPISAAVLSAALALALPGIASAQAPAASPAFPPPSLVPVPIDEAIQRAALLLMLQAPEPRAPGEKREVVVDPLIDGHTGAQNATTVRMGTAISNLIKGAFSRFKVVPFTQANVGKQPLALIGTFRPLNTKNVAGSEPDAYHICLALIDLKNGTVASKGVARSTVEGVDATPTPAFRDAPLWLADNAVSGYIKSCQTTKVGDKIDPAYAERMEAGTLIAGAINAYNDKRYREALELYRAALKSPGGDQPRVRNGIYMAAWRLKQAGEAREAFAAMVDQGLKSSKLSAQMLFGAGSPLFARSSQSEYDMWLRVIGERTVAARTCLEVVGHTSRTGLAAINDLLSVRRAEFVRSKMVERMPAIGERLIASGVGSKEAIVGTTPDTPQNAIDRRVEFKTIKCST